MATIQGLHGLMIDNLRDILSAELQLVQALPTMAEAAATPDLRDAMRTHLAQTKKHVARLEEVFQELETGSRAKHCKGMEGLLEEGKEVLEMDSDPFTRDSGLIGAAQKVEHYEIAAYQTILALAGRMGHTSVVELLKPTLEEEQETEALLTQIAERSVNPQAETGMDADDDADDRQTERGDTGSTREAWGSGTSR